MPQKKAKSKEFQLSERVCDDFYAPISNESANPKNLEEELLSKRDPIHNHGPPYYSDFE